MNHLHLSLVTGGCFCFFFLNFFVENSRYDFHLDSENRGKPSCCLTCYDTPLTL